MNLLLIGASFFIVLIIIGVILYFVFQEDPEEEDTEETQDDDNSTIKPDKIKTDFSKGDTLLQNQELLSGSGLKSKNNNFTAVMQPDGNFVIFDFKRAIWKTNTSGTNLKLKFEGSTPTPDGKVHQGSLQIYDTSNTPTIKWYMDPVFAVNNGKLVMQNDGDLVMYSGNDIRWSSKKGIVYNYEKGDTLNIGTTLWYQQGLMSKNGKYTLVVQNDGNIVAYNENKNAMWATNTFVNNNIRTGNAMNLLFMIDGIDGKLVAQDYQSNIKWELKIPELGGNSKLVMQDDGNIVIYDSLNVARWSSWYGYGHTLKNWVCKKDGVKQGNVFVNWGEESGHGVWACNSWLSSCENKCTVDTSNWECKKGETSVGLQEIGTNITQLNSKWDAQWACNQWKPDCKENGVEKCLAYAVDPVEYRKTNSTATIPNTCPSDKENVGGLCYTKCSAGYSGVLTNCVKNCPEGFRDDGYYCAKPAPYGRGEGYAWRLGDRIGDYSGAKRRCESENPQGCDQDGLLYYPKCKNGFHAFGCCTCTPDCEAGSTDIGVSCQKQMYGRGVGVPMDCPANKEKIGGLCYNNQ